MPSVSCPMFLWPMTAHSPMWIRNLKVSSAQFFCVIFDWGYHISRISTMNRAESASILNRRWRLSAFCSMLSRRLFLATRSLCSDIQCDKNGRSENFLLRMYWHKQFLNRKESAAFSAHTKNAIYICKQGATNYATRTYEHAKEQAIRNVRNMSSQF